MVIKVARSQKEVGMMGCKPSDTLIEGNHRLRARVESKQVEKGRYHGLVRKLI